MEWSTCRQGGLLREVAYLPLAEDIPITFNSCRKGPRGIDWRADKDAEFSWIEAQVSPQPYTCPGIAAELLQSGGWAV